jgi:hypothetical protein
LKFCKFFVEHHKLIYSGQKERDAESRRRKTPTLSLCFWAVNIIFRNVCQILTHCFTNTRIYGADISNCPSSKFRQSCLRVWPLKRIIWSPISVCMRTLRQHQQHDKIYLVFRSSNSRTPIQQLSDVTLRVYYSAIRSPL